MRAKRLPKEKPETTIALLKNQNAQLLERIEELSSRIGVAVQRASQVEAENHRIKENMDASNRKVREQASKIARLEGYIERVNHEDHPVRIMGSESTPRDLVNRTVTDAGRPPGYR